MRALVVKEEEVPVLAIVKTGTTLAKTRQINWAADGDTVDSLAISWSLLPITVAEEVVGVQLVVSQKEEGIAVKLVTT